MGESALENADAGCLNVFALRGILNDAVKETKRFQKLTERRSAVAFVDLEQRRGQCFCFSRFLMLFQTEAQHSLMNSIYLSLLVSTVQH